MPTSPDYARAIEILEAVAPYWDLLPKEMRRHHYEQALRSVGIKPTKTSVHLAYPLRMHGISLAVASAVFRSAKAMPRVRRVAKVDINESTFEPVARMMETMKPHWPVLSYKNRKRVLGAIVNAVGVAQVDVNMRLLSSELCHDCAASLSDYVTAKKTP